MNLFEINDICKDKLRVLEYLQRQKIIHAEVQCDLCQLACRLQKDGLKLSGYIWRCNGCRKKQSVLKDSFLEGCKIPPAKFVYLVFYWATSTPQVTTVHHLDISSKTGVDYYKFLRDICTWKLLQSPVELVDDDKEVQRRTKAAFRRMHGTSKSMVQGYLDETLWRLRYGSTFHLAHCNILRHISERYPC